MSDMTPGPWKAITVAGVSCVIEEQHRSQVAGYTKTPNAHLMAAAPELLAVAQFLLSIEQDLRQRLCQCDNTYCAYCSWLNEAQWAVNKALGLPCAVCDDVGVVATTRIDQDGEHVEILCPVCQKEGGAMSEEDYLVECCNEDCGWEGCMSETVHPKHDATQQLCPECHEVTEPVDDHP